MADYQSYLDDRLKEVKETREYLNQELIVEKERIQSNLNQKMLKYIKHAEEKFEAIIKDLSEDFKKNMEELEKEKKRGIRSSVRLELHEKFLKNTFEKNLGEIIFILNQDIKNYRAKIK